MDNEIQEENNTIFFIVTGPIVSAEQKGTSALRR